MRAAQRTLVDLFEVRSSSTGYAYVPPMQRERQPSIELEIDWDEVRAEHDKSGVRMMPTEDHDWSSSSSDSTPGVSSESWHRARGWSSE